jgi:hypothetical protein
MKVTKLRFIAMAALAVCSAVWPAGQANAISLSIDSITPLAGNTATGIYNSGNRQSSYDSAASVLNAGTSAADLVGAAVTGGTRYASTQTSDSESVFSGASDLTATASYQILFTVNAPLNAIYDLEIDTSRIGAFVVRQEAASASNSLGAVSGTFAAPSQALNALAALPGLNTSSTTVSPFSQTGSTVIAGLTGGVQQFTLQFTWTGTTHSDNGINGGDESVILMGLDTRINSKVGAADDYPGTSGRTNPAGDGHFVNVTATITQIVPEPSTYVLAGMSMLSLGAVAIRRKRRA